MKGIFADRSPLLQVGVLLVMILTGLLIGSVIGSLVLIVAALPTGNLAADPMQQPVLALQAAQFITATFTFLLPACCTAWVCSSQPKEYLSIRSFSDRRLLGLVCLATLLLAPAISWIGYFNAEMQLPESMGAIEEWMKSTEELAEALVQRMIGEKGAVAYIINLFVIAVVAGVTEEFLFRGALLRIARQLFSNHHVAIWIVAFIFSFIHFQFYGFVPRMLLGAFFGYLVFWTQNIWIPVLAHLLHNAVAFVGMSSDALKDNALFADKVAPEDLRWLSIVSCLCLIAFFFCLRWIQKATNPNRV